MSVTLLDQIQNHPSDWMYAHLREKFSEYSTEAFNLRLKEFFKFIYLASKYKTDRFIPVNKEIDAIWHEYILQTRDYEKLCKELPGQRFIHHQSNPLEEYIDERDREEVIRGMLAWLPVYYENFGEFTKEISQFWAIVVFCMKELDMSLEDINELAKEAFKQPA